MDIYDGETINRLLQAVILFCCFSHFSNPSELIRTILLVINAVFLSALNSETSNARKNVCDRSIPSIVC